jgi:hypothetical protein
MKQRQSQRTTEAQRNERNVEISLASVFAGYWWNDVDSELVPQENEQREGKSARFRLESGR